MKGGCHCGAVTIAVPHPPKDLTERHCSICRRYGALWAYYRNADVSIAGPTDVYVRGRRHISFLRCAECGCVMGWKPRGDYPECAVNARMPPEGLDLDATPRIVEDDASVLSKIGLIRVGRPLIKLMNLLGL